MPNRDITMTSLKSLRSSVLLVVIILHCSS